LLTILRGTGQYRLHVILDYQQAKPAEENSTSKIITAFADIEPRHALSSTLATNWLIRRLLLSAFEAGSERRSVTLS